MFQGDGRENSTGLLLSSGGGEEKVEGPAMPLYFKGDIRAKDVAFLSS